MRTLSSIASLLLMILCASAAHAQSANERLLEDGRYEELVAKLKSSSVDDLESRLLLSQAHEGLEDFDAAIRVAKASTKSHPTMATAHLRLAEALRAKMSRSGKIKAMMILGDYKKAFRKARELDPNNLSAREEQIGFLTQAPGVAGGDKKKAAELIAELKRMDLTRGSRLEARLLQGAGEDEKAVAVLEKHCSLHRKTSHSARRQRWPSSARSDSLRPTKFLHRCLRVKTRTA